MISCTIPTVPTKNKDNPQNQAYVAERKRLLDEAEKCICTDRNQQYGEPEDSFAVIARLWSAYLKKNIKPEEAAIMMGLFKIARMMTGSYKDDTYIDCIGYIACAGEIAERATGTVKVPIIPNAELMQYLDVGK